MNNRKSNKGYFNNVEKNNVYPNIGDNISIAASSDASTYSQETTVLAGWAQQLETKVLLVGWIVGVSGAEYGKHYPLYTCDNSIGSNNNNTICIMGDRSVCSVRHCTLSFDVRRHKLYYNSVRSVGKVYVNHNPIMQDYFFKHLDCIQIGNSSFRYVELCRDGFSWWENGTGNDDGIHDEVKIDDIDDAFSDSDKAVKTSDLALIRAKMLEKSIVRNTDNTYTAWNESSSSLPYEAETSVLSLSTWRCLMCNGENSQFDYVCRICGVARK